MARGDHPGRPLEARVPRFGVSADGQGGAWVVCSRCGGAHHVELKRWLAGEKLEPSTKTRPCPYCFRVSIPHDGSNPSVVESS